MDVPQLRTLIAVAELGSLSKAAHRLNIVQPALSRHIRMLEAELAVPLFTRHGRGMVITEQGREILARAQRIMAELDEIRAGAMQADAPLTGQVSIGLPPTVADLISTPLVVAFRQAHPQVLLRIVSAYTGYLTDWLDRGEIDLAVLYDPRSARGLHARPLLVENLLVIGPAEAGFSSVEGFPFANLAQHRLLLPSTRHGLRTIIERCAEEAGIALDVVVEADSYTTLKDLVRAGHGLTILPLAPIHEDIRAGRLTASPLVDPAPTRRLTLATASGRPISRLGRFAAEQVRAIVRDCVERGDWVGYLLGET